MPEKRQLSVLLIAAILYFVLITAFYHHHSFSVRAGCSLCKFIAELYVADNAAPPQQIIPFFVPLYAFPENSLTIIEIFSDSPDARAPPVFIPSNTS